MGVISSIIGRMVGSKKTQYERVIGSDARLARKMRRDAKLTKKTEAAKKRLLGDINAAIKKLSSNQYLPEHVAEVKKVLEKKIKDYVGLVQKEIRSNAHLLVGVEALYYRLKEKQIEFIKENLSDIIDVGFPQKLHESINNKFVVLDSEYKGELDELSGVFRRQYKGRFDLQAVSVWSERHLSKVIVKDTKKIRSLIRKIESEIDKLEEVEVLGKVEATYKILDQLMNNVKSEMGELLEIALEDVKIMHKLTNEINDLATEMNKIPQPDIRILRQHLVELHKFEENTLRSMYKSLRSESRREAA